MELLQLKYLCTAARFENFSRAAKFHNIPQSAISKTIAQLERELGAQLFVRNGNRVVLNERGKQFCREVSRALGILNDAAQHAKTGDDLHGEVRLLAEEHHGELLRLISDFKKDHPTVTFTVLTQYDEGFDYDLRVCARAAMPARTAGEKLRDARVQLLLPANHRLAGEDRLSPSSLAGDGQIVFAKGTPATQAIGEFLRRAGVDLPVIMTCDDRASLYAYVGAGLGIAFASGVSVREAEEAGVVLCRLREDWQYPTCLSYRRTLSPAAEALRTAILERLGAAR